MLEALFDKPIVTVGDVQKLIGNSYPATNNLVSGLVALGILEEVTGYVRNRRFRTEPYVRMFSEEPSTGPS